MLVSPRPAFTNCVLSFTLVGGFTESRLAIHINFKVHVGGRFPFLLMFPDDL